MGIFGFLQFSIVFKECKTSYLYLSFVIVFSTTYAFLNFADTFGNNPLEQRECSHVQHTFKITCLFIRPFVFYWSMWWKKKYFIPGLT